MTEETFARALERRAETVHGTPLTFEDVRGRARSIRRRRRTTVAGAVAAVVAAVVLVPTVLTGGSDQGAPDPAPAPPVVQQTSVLHDRTLTLPDGSTVPLDVDNRNVTELGVLTDGRVVVALQEPYAVRVYGPDGVLDEEYAVQANTITLSAGDDVAAWVGEDFRIQVLSSGVAEPTSLAGIPMPGESVGSIDAVIDAEHLIVGDGSTTTGQVTAEDGYQDLSTSEPLRVTDVSPDGELWAVRVEGDDPQYGCSGLYDPATDQVVARNCDTSGLIFSADGQHLMGLRGDNNMYDHVDIVDRDLVGVGAYTPTGETQVVSRAAWADPSHLLVTTADYASSEWSLVRVGLDGAEQEVVAGPVDGRNPEMLVEYLLSE